MSEACFRAHIAFPLTLTLLLSVPIASSAAEVALFRQEARAEALEGEVEGTSVGADGELRLAPRFERLGGLDEPFLFAAAPYPGGGAILGSGNDGKVFKVDDAGVANLLGSLPEPSVFAVHATVEGNVLAAASPSGKVMRLAAEGVIEEFFDPQSTYVWDLAEDSSGRVLVATGLPGRVYRLNPDGSGAETIYESPDRHVRALLPRADGSLVVGTAGQGLIVEIDAAGRARTLYDAAEPEVLGFASDGDVLYAALLASEASQVDLSAVTSGEGEAASGSETIGSRASSYEGPRSRVMALEAAKSPRLVASLDDETIHALTYFDGELWLGTGQEGGLFRLEKEELILEQSFDERQLVALFPGMGERGKDSSSLFVATTDSVALHRFGGERQNEGLFTSRVLDAAHASRFGVLRWWGEVDGGEVSFEVRAGMALKPDATWSDWRSLGALAGEGASKAIDEQVGISRYVQWRARLKAGRGGDGPRVDAVELSYRQVNQAPKITELEVLDPGAILVSQSFNPNSTTFEPWSPNRDGIFNRLRAEKNDGQLKTLWKRGYRTLRFKASDANSDELIYKLEVQRSEAADGEAWLPVAEELDEAWFSFDATVLPDGIYRFRVTASDRSANPHGDALEDHLRSDPVVIDHTPPRLLDIAWNGERAEIGVEDEMNPIRHAVYSVDAGPWRAVESVDGLLDSRRERLRLEVPGEAGVVLLRLTDAALNVVTLAVK